jgi:GNAT superfamily N-acetyltransferase
MLVRPFCPHDVSFAAEMSAREGWETSDRDYESLFHFEPQGCFTALVDGEPVGVALTIAYGKLGWISRLVVRQDVRGCGYGRALLDRAVAYLLDRGARTVGLDATPQSVELYTRSGFKPAYDLLYLRRPPLPAPASHSDTLVPLRARDLHAVAMFDWACFGANRERVLRGLLQLSPVAYLAQSSSGVAGYAMARVTHDHWTIGPWVCKHGAETLLTRTLNAIGPQAAHVGVPALNEHALSLLQAQGFVEYYRETRMYQGDPEGIGQPEHIYGIASAEKG